MPDQSPELVEMVRELQEAVEQLRSGVLFTWMATMGRTPLHIEHVDVGGLEFRLDHVDVNDLGGELNIGFTNMLKTGDGGKQGKPETPPPKTLRELKDQLTKDFEQQAKKYLAKEQAEAVVRKLEDALEKALKEVLSPPPADPESKEKSPKEAKRLWPPPKEGTS